MAKSMERKMIDAMIRYGLTDKQFSPRTFARVMSLEAYEVQDSFIQAVGMYVDEMTMHVNTNYNTVDNILDLAHIVHQTFPPSGQQLFEFD